MAAPAAEAITIDITRMKATCSNGSVYVGYSFGRPKLTRRGIEKIKMHTKLCELKTPTGSSQERSRSLEPDISSNPRVTGNRASDDHSVKMAWKSYDLKKVYWQLLKPAPLKKINEETEEEEEAQQEKEELAELNRMQLLITQEYTTGL